MFYRILLLFCILVSGCQKPQNGNAEGIGGFERPAKLLPCQGCDPDRPVLWACQTADDEARDLRVRVYEEPKGLVSHIEEFDSGQMIESQQTGLTILEQPISNGEGVQGGTLYLMGASPAAPLNLHGINVTATDFPTLLRQEYASLISMANPGETGLTLSDLNAVCWLLDEKEQVQ